MTNELNISILLAGVIAGAAPIVLASLGETITEKAGLINLSLDGSILLSAMAAFAVASESGSLIAGFFAAALIGAIVAAIVAVFSVYLGQSQVAVGFVLTLMTRDLAYFLGNSYSRVQGPQVSPFPIPLLKDIPFFGTVFFSHNLMVYASMLLIAFCWWYIYRTRAGLELRAVGEHPEAAYSRGINPKKIQMLYAVCGGCLVGLAGASFSLCTKPGWGRPQGAEGTGWIALAIVIFGGWHPVKAAVGAYLFSFLQVLGIYLQGIFPSVPAQVFQVAPFPLMIFTLLLMSLARKESVLIRAENKAWMKAVLKFFSSTAPGALGRAYRHD
ncbi:MAG: ABC transporter permease [Desulfobacteraceae bacterium IS3]|nr:MAG: ABC transporter permease [Desulfobacteraceae bacterium IS3]